MNNPWKLTTIGLLVTAVTALTSGLTTAYFLKATAPSADPEARRAPASLAGARVTAPAPFVSDVVEPQRPPIARATRISAIRPAVSARPVAVEPVAAVKHDTTPGEVTQAEAVPPPAAPTASPAPVATSGPTPTPVITRSEPVAAASTKVAPTDCATGGGRALRIAKPGALGGLLGAGLGAAGGAIADGGKGAGKGALWGGLAGAAAGSAYGAYKTRQDCGTILGGPTGAAKSGAGSSAPVPTPAPSVGDRSEASFTARGESGANRDTARGITIYNAR
jgi:hypothetical protein